MASAALVQCTFFANRAPWGGNVSADCSGTITVDRCIIAGSSDGLGLLVDGSSSVQLTCTDIWGNASGDWVPPFASQLGQNGNLCADPLFCGSASRDFTLAETSPCVPDQSGDCGQIGAWPVGCAGPVAVEMAGTQVSGIVLAPSFPNPFNPATTLRFTLPAAATIRLSIHALDGRLVASVAEGPRAAGHHEVIWRGLDVAGRPAPSGAYLAVLEAAGDRHSRSLVLLR